MDAGGEKLGGKIHSATSAAILAHAADDATTDRVDAYQVIEDDALSKRSSISGADMVRYARLSNDSRMLRRTASIYSEGPYAVLQGPPSAPDVYERISEEGEAGGEEHYRSVGGGGGSEGGRVLLPGAAGAEVYMDISEAEEVGGGGGGEGGDGNTYGGRKAAEPSSAGAGAPSRFVGFFQEGEEAYESLADEYEGG